MTALGEPPSAVCAADRERPIGLSTARDPSAPKHGLTAPSARILRALTTIAARKAFSFLVIALAAKPAPQRQAAPS
jgi:hypothetical protein